MNTTQLTPELIEQVRGLSQADRIKLYDLVEAEVEYSPAELQAELQARWDEYVADPSIAKPAAELIAKLRAKQLARTK